MNEVIAYIERLNAQTEAWVAEDPEGRWAGLLTTDPEHWAGYGITTVEALEEYFDACAAKEARKAAYIEDEYNWMDDEEFAIFEGRACEIDPEAIALRNAAGPYGDYESLTDPENWG